MRTLYSIFLLVLIFFSGFLVSYFLFKSQCSWNCPPTFISGQNSNFTTLLDENFASIVLNKINQAKERIDIAMFEFRFYKEKNKARMIEDALIEASNKGIKIRILLDQSDWNPNIKKKNQKTLNYLKENSNINVKFDNPKKTLHAKLWIIDNSVIIGSHNIGFYALEKNYETSILIENPKIVDQYENYFEWLWNKS